MKDKEIIILALSSSLAVTALLANNKNTVTIDNIRANKRNSPGGKSYRRNKKQRNKRSCKRK